MACTVKLNQQGKVVSVNAPNGAKSELFQNLNKNIFIGSKNISWDIQKNVYSDSVEKKFNGVKSDEYVYSTGEPKIFYKSSGKDLTESLEETLLNTNVSNVEMGFKDPNTNDFIKIGNFEVSNNENDYTGFLISQVRKGQLAAEKVERDGEFLFQGKGSFESTQRINGEIFNIESAVLLEGRKVKVNHDGTFNIPQNHDLHIARKGDTVEIIPTENLEEALLNSDYDNKVALAISLLINKGEWRPIDSKFTGKKTTIPKEKAQLISSLFNFLSRMGFSVTSIEKYDENFKAREGKDPSVQALVDINNKMLAFAEGKLTLSTLTEEVAHLAIEAFKDQGSIDSLLSQVVHYKEYQQYASAYRNKYSEKHSGIELEDMVRREVLGKILA